MPIDRVVEAASSFKNRCTTAGHCGGGRQQQRLTNLEVGALVDALNVAPRLTRFARLFRLMKPGRP